MPKKHKLKPLVTFQLVHRSQQDPLVSDENAPQHVLMPITKETKESKEQRIEDQQKYGIYFEDDSNYMQHLKDRKDNRVQWPDNVDELVREIEDRAKPKLNLPASVFASKAEDEVGMLNKAAPVTGLQLHLDRDVVAAMDEDFDFDDPNNQLEDNFMEMAGSEVSGEECDEKDEISSNYDSEEMDEVGLAQGPVRSLAKSGTKSRFTEYSLTSSLMKRNEGLQLLDARFEKFYEQYDASEIGALDGVEIEGHISMDDERLQDCLREFENSRKTEQLGDPEFDEKTREYMRRAAEAPLECETVKVEPTAAEQEDLDNWSVVGAKAKHLNLPEIIDVSRKPSKITVDKHTGIPNDTLGNHKLTTQALGRLDQENSRKTPTDSESSATEESLVSRITALSTRSKNETPEERRARKHALKEYRRERRIEKKQNSILFKEITKKQVKSALNKDNMRGTKML